MKVEFGLAANRERQHILNTRLAVLRKGCENTTQLAYVRPAVHQSVEQVRESLSRERSLLELGLERTGTGGEFRMGLGLGMLGLGVGGVGGVGSFGDVSVDDDAADADAGVSGGLCMGIGMGMGMGVGVSGGGGGFADGERDILDLDEVQHANKCAQDRPTIYRMALFSHPYFKCFVHSQQKGKYCDQPLYCTPPPNADALLRLERNEPDMNLICTAPPPWSFEARDKLLVAVLQDLRFKHKQPLLNRFDLQAYC